MIVLSGTAIFWFIAEGLAIGWVLGSIIKEEGIPLWANLIWGATGAIITGSIAIFLGLGDGLLFAFVGTLAILFLANAFHQHHEEDIFGDEEDIGVHIISRH